MGESCELAPASVELGDMFAADLAWSADIVLVNATGFGDELMARCAAKVRTRSLACVSDYADVILVCTARIAPQKEFSILANILILNSISQLNT